MRLLITADLHYDHPKSAALAEAVIAEINRAGGDVLLVVGDTATSNGDSLEKCLALFRFNGPKLFVAGNHELWTDGDDSYAIYTTQLPQRVRKLGWQWLEGEPFLADGIGIVGTVGWYDYSFAQASLQIPQRFYRHKVSPGAAAHAHLSEFAHLLDTKDDVPPHAMSVIARWNDGRFVKLHRSDEQFLHELMTKLDRQLAQVSPRVGTVVAATHHLPFRELLPPPHSAQWDFAKAYLGSDAIGGTLLRYENVRHAYCGHSHFAAETTIGHVHAVNVGSGYRAKKFLTLDL
jgi:Icc-related predicted phosphoesterase